MQRRTLKSKIHRATVTARDPDYAIEGERGSGELKVNGAALLLDSPLASGASV